MKEHEFFKKFANLPLGKRMVVLNKIGCSDLTMYEIYKQLHEINDVMRPWILKQESLLSVAEEGFKNLKDK